MSTPTPKNQPVSFRKKTEITRKIVELIKKELPLVTDSEINCQMYNAYALHRQMIR